MERKVSSYVHYIFSTLSFRKKEYVFTTRHVLLLIHFQEKSEKFMRVLRFAAT
jgi:hypothetical protein